MDRQQIGLRVAIKRLALPFRITTFEDRLIVQKVVYLAEAARVNLGYYYQWYLYGPYCPTLTRDAYTIEYELSQGFDESEGWVLDEESSKRLKKLKALMGSMDRGDLARRLELLASVHFLVDRGRCAKGDVRGITSTLGRFKKDFSDEEVKNAVRELVDHGLLTE